MHTTSLGELGQQLPIGSVNGKELVKPFELRPFKSRVDRHLGLWEEAHSGSYVEGELLARKVAKLISLLVVQAGGLALPAAGDANENAAANELAIHKMYFSDVLYMYLAARVQSLGNELEHPVACPGGKCDFTTDAAIFDLSTIDVRVADTVEDLYAWVPLKRPYKLRDGSTMLNQVKLEPVRWATMAKPGVLGGPMSQLATISLQDSICAVNGKDGEYRLTPDELDEMEKIDRVIINRTANKVAAGVDMETSIVCPKCGIKITNPLNWTYDYFFDASLPLEI